MDEDFKVMAYLQFCDNDKGKKLGILIYENWDIEKQENYIEWLHINIVHKSLFLKQGEKIASTRHPHLCTHNKKNDDVSK